MRRILYFGLSKNKLCKSPLVMSMLRVLEKNPNNQVEKYLDQRDQMEKYGIRSVPCMLIIQEGREDELYVGTTQFEIVAVLYA